MSGRFEGPAVAYVGTCSSVSIWSLCRFFLGCGAADRRAWSQSSRGRVRWRQL